MSRFDYVKYDEIAQNFQISAKAKCESLEEWINGDSKQSRYKSLALTALEECYMWIGKMIRDDQIKRDELLNVKSESL